MKYLPLLLLALVISCEEVELPPASECQLAKIVVTGSNFETTTEYTYDASGRMARQVRTRPGQVIFDYTYSFKADGNVGRLDMIDRYLQFEHSANGKIASTTTYMADGTEVGRTTYSFAGNNVTVESTNSQQPNPYHSTVYEFMDENIVRTVSRTWTGQEPNRLLSESESIYEDFDTALNAFYVSRSSRRGYGTESSKNNPGKQTVSTTFYDQNGQVTQESTSTHIFTYTYNDSNAALTIQSVTGGSEVVNTSITYDNCN